MSTRIPPETRSQILTAIKDGMSITQAAETHHVSDRTIAKWLRQGTSSGELSKAKKEIDFLKSVILDLVLEQKALNRKG